MKFTLIAVLDSDIPFDKGMIGAFIDVCHSKSPIFLENKGFELSYKHVSIEARITARDVNIHYLDIEVNLTDDKYAFLEGKYLVLFASDKDNVYIPDPNQMREYSPSILHSENVKFQIRTFDPCVINAMQSGLPNFKHVQSCQVHAQNGFRFGVDSLVGPGKE